MEQDRRIEEILNSSNGMTKVVPDDLLFSKILRKIDERKKLPTTYVWLAAASFAVLLSLNIKFIMGKSNNSNTGIETVAMTMANTNQLY